MILEYANQSTGEQRQRKTERQLEGTVEIYRVSLDHSANKGSLCVCSETETGEVHLVKDLTLDLHSGHDFRVLR